MRKYLISLLGSSIIIIGGIFISSVFHYFNIISNFTMDVLKLIIMFVSLFYTGFIMGKNSKKNGYLSGLKGGSLIVIILIIYNLIFNRIFSFRVIIFYLILLFISTIGGMIGISKAKENK